MGWVGSDEAADAHASSAHEVVDLDGALVTPAFVDAHAHVTETGLALTGVELSSARSLAEVLSRVEDASRRSQRPACAGPRVGRTGLARGARADHGRARPRLLRRLGLPLARGRALGRGLERAGRGRPAAGPRRLGRRRPGRAGRPPRRPRRHPVDPDARPAPGPAARGVDGAAAAAGIGCVHEMSAPHIGTAEDLRGLLQLAAERAADRRSCPTGASSSHCRAGPRAGPSRSTCPPGTPLRGLAGDLCVDGSIGSRTAALRAPYADARGHVAATGTSTRRAGP